MFTSEPLPLLFILYSQTAKREGKGATTEEKTKGKCRLTWEMVRDGEAAGRMVAHKIIAS